MKVPHPLSLVLVYLTALVLALPGCSYIAKHSDSTQASVSMPVDSGDSQDSAGALVRRDANGGFSAGTIIATLNGNATSATSAVSAQSANTATTAGSANTANSANTAATAGSFTGSLAGDVTGTQSATVVGMVGGQAAASIAAGVLAANGATASNSAGKLVLRDASGNFSAGRITALGFIGDGSQLTGINLSGSAGGDLAGTYPNPAVASVGGIPAAGVASGIGLVNAATSADTAGAIVRRDASGNFSAGTITANLTGNATNVTGVVAIANGGTGGTTAAGARSGLGLGSAAIANVGTGANNVVQLDPSAKLPSVDGSQLMNLPQAGSLADVGGRLTLTTGVPINASDVTGGILFYTAYLHNRIALFSAGAWQDFTFNSDLSLNLNIAAGDNYDVFIFNNGGAPTLELSTGWPNAAPRATPVRQDGILVKQGDPTRRYVGTIHASATNTTEDSKLRRFVWNFYNRVPGKLKVAETTASWTYTGTSYRPINNNPAIRVQVVIGFPGDTVELRYAAEASNVTTYGIVGLGIDRTNGNDADAFQFSNVPQFASLTAFLTDQPAAPGLHFYQAVEITGGGQVIFHGSNIPVFSAVVPVQLGVVGTLSGH